VNQKLYFNLIYIFSMKTIFTYFLSFFTIAAYSQKLISNQSFSTSEIPVTAQDHYRPFISNFSYENDQLNIYSIQSFKGKIVEVTNEKKKSGILGISTFSGSDYQDIISYITKTTLDSDLKVLNKTADFVYEKVLDSTKTFKIELSPLANNKEFPAKTSIKYDYKRFLKSSPDFLNNIQPVEYTYLKTESDGVLKLKNLNINYIKSSDFYTLSGGHLKAVNDTKMVKKADWNKKYSGYTVAFLGGKQVEGSLSDNLNVEVIALYEKEGEKFAFNKYYSFIVYDNDGNEVNKIDYTADYLKLLDNSYIVYNTAGEKTGLVFVFKNTLMMGNKKLKDPNDNRYNLFYIDTNGKLKLKTEFILGENEDKSFYFNPMYIQEEGNRLKVINDHFTSVFKSYRELLTIDEKGIVTAEKMDPEKSKSTFLASSNIIFQNNKKVVYEPATKGEDYVDKNGKSAIKTLYTGLFLTEISEDMSTYSLKKVLDLKPSETKIITNEIYYKDQVFLILCHNDGNSIIPIANNGKILNILPKDAFLPVTPAMESNYYFDEENGFIYFFYEGNIPGTGKISKVSLN
jgi:hypothetical protein